AVAALAAVVVVEVDGDADALAAAHLAGAGAGVVVRIVDGRLVVGRRRPGKWAGRGLSAVAGLLVELAGVGLVPSDTQALGVEIALPEAAVAVVVTARQVEELVGLAEVLRHSPG